MTYNLLLLKKDMGFKKKPFDKRNKVIWKGKSKIHVIIKSNGGSLKKGYQCGSNTLSKMYSSGKI